MFQSYRDVIKAVMVVGLLAVPRVALAVGQEVGRLVGRVTEAQSNAAVPGASIVVTGKALIGPPRQVTTDEDGHYEVPNLAPGTYEVELSFSGVTPLRRRVEVAPSVATPVDIVWSVELAQAETSTITVERHPTNPDSSMTGSVFSVAKMEYVPLARSYQSTLGQAAGVIGTGNANVRGGTTRSNRFLIDGLDITDVATNTFRGNWQFEAADSIQVITGGFEAKYNAVGSVTNILTRSGSDEFHFSANYYVRPSRLQAFTPVGNQTFDGGRPFADDVKPPLGDNEFGLIVDGPLIKHQLWYSATFRYSKTTVVQPAGPPLNVQAPSRVFQLFQPRLKLTWAPNAKHKFSAQFLADPTTIDFANNTNGGTSQANNTEPLAAFTQNQGGWHVMTEWDYFITQNLDSKVLLGFQRSGITGGAQGKVNGLDPKYGVYNFDQPRHVNNVDGTAWGNQATYSVDGRPKWQLDASMTYRTRFFGLHEAEVGFQGLFSHFTSSVTPTGGGFSYTDNGGGPGKGGLCSDDPFVVGGSTAGCNQKTFISGYSNATFNYNLGVYAQDRWKPTKWLTILPGLRWDRYEDRLKTDPDDPHPAYGSRALLYGFGPRLALIADITGDQKTIFQVSYGRATQPVYAATVTSVAIANKQVNQTFTWDRNLNGGAGGFGPPVDNSGIGTSYLDTNNHTPAHSDEILLRLSRELSTTSVVEIDYSYKRVSNIFELVETNRIWDPSGNRVIGYADPSIPKAITLSTYPNNSYTKYSGFSLVFDSRPTPNLDFQGSYTLSWTYGPTYDDNQLSNQYANPRQTDLYYGYALDTDTRHAIKTATSYTFKGAIFGVLFNWNTGAPNRKQFTQ